MMAGVPRSNPARWGLLLLVRLGAGGALYAQTVAVDDVAVMRMLCRKTQPEWSDAQLDSAAAAWTQWSAQGAPRNAEALAVLWPDQQFALERYQAQFGWPRDSTEWRAIALSGIQRELLQRLYHGARSRSHTPGRSGLALREPLFSVGWTASDALQGAWTARRLGSGAQLGLVGATSSLGIVPWSIRSPSDEVLRGWAEPGSYALALQPGKARAGAPRLLRDVERLALGRSASSPLLGEVAVRRAAWAAAAGLGAGGWWLLQGSWYGPGGLLVQVQREGFRGEAKGLGWVRPGADATPWRALLGRPANLGGLDTGARRHGSLPEPIGWNGLHGHQPARTGLPGACPRCIPSASAPKPESHRGTGPSEHHLKVRRVPTSPWPYEPLATGAYRRSGMDLPPRRQPSEHPDSSLPQRLER